MQDKKTSLSIAGSGFTLQAAILLVFSVFKLVGIHSIAWVLPVSLAVTILATSGLLASRNGLGISALFKLNALFLALLAASLYVASIFYDQSFDGRWYHQEGVIQLNRGFDPFRQTLDENSLPGHVWSIASTRMPMSSSPLWINHYPKGSEIVAASIFALRMGMEAAKGFNFLLLASAILLTYGTFLEYWPGRHRTAALLAAAIGLNPVVVGQLWSNYNDGQLYLLLVGLACALSLHHREGSRRWLVLAGLVSIGLLETKFTGLVYAVVGVAGYGVLELRRRGATSALRSSLVLASFLCLGVGLVGFNPYVRNTVEKGHPFYPILGEHRIDIMSINMDSTFGAKVRLEKFQESLLGRSSVQFHLERGRIPPKIPFTFTRAEFESVSTPDPRVAGFGPLFGGILILSLSVGMASFALLFLRRHSGAPSAWRIPTGGKSDLWLLIGLVAASALANPELWWARYVPQLWTLPLLVALGLGGPLSDRVGLATRWVVVAAMLLTGFASLGIGAFQGARSSMVVERDLMRLESSRTPLTVYYGVRTGDRLKYLDRPISVRPVDQIDSLEGKFRDTLLCGGIIQYDDSELHASFHQHGKGLQVNGALLHRFVSDRLVPFL